MTPPVVNPALGPDLAVSRMRSSGPDAGQEDAAREAGVVGEERQPRGRRWGEAPHVRTAAGPGGGGEVRQAGAVRVAGADPQAAGEGGGVGHEAAGDELGHRPADGIDAPGPDVGAAALAGAGDEAGEAGGVEDAAGDVDAAS